MADKELQAHEFVRRRNWSRAIALYDQLLAPTAITFKTSKDRIIASLLGRCECLLELGKYENCITDAKRVLKMLNDIQDCSASIARVRRRLIHSLYKLKRFQEAEVATKEWIHEASSQPSFMDISKTLERYKTVIQMANGQKTNQRISLQRLDDEMLTLDTKLEHWATNNLPLDKFSKLLTNKGVKTNNKRENCNNTTILSTTVTGHNNNSTNTNTNNSNSTGNSSNGNNSNSSSNSTNNTTNTGISLSSSIINTTEQLENLKLSETSQENLDGSVTCSYCAISFLDKNELRQHCQTENHQNVIMSDEGRDWKWRPPPRGYTIDSYTICESFSESQSCHYGNQCVEAHGLDELNEWKERFEYRKMRLQRACEKELYGKSYTEELLDKWIQATSPEKVMCEKINGVEEQCSNELVTTISSKVSKRDWIFILKTKKLLKAVALLQDAHRHHFAIKSIQPGDLKSTSSTITLLNNNSGAGSTNSNTNNNNNSNNNNNNKVSNNNLSSPITTTQSSLKQQLEIELKSDQEWVSTTFDRNFQPTHDSPILEHKIRIAFTTDIYGTFRQSVCFDFGTEPVLVKHLCVDVVPVGDAEKIQEIKKDIINSAVQRWDETNTNLVKFETVIGSHLKTEAYLNDIKREKDLLERYPCPRAATFTLTQSTILEKRLTKNNYRSRIHELLYVEEIARYEQIARYNLTTKLRITSNYMLTPSGMATSTAKYSHSGELFGLMQMGKDISEDTSAGRLILSSCTSVYLSPTLKNDDKQQQQQNKKRDVFEATIEDKGKNIIYLKLSSKCVQALNLKPDTDFIADIQFQLNRLSYCEWHNAVDKITDFRIIFPDTFIEPNIPWTPKKQWSDSCDPKLNAKQKEAVNAITTPVNVHLPPILLIGPFGTGKTYTLAQGIKQLLNQPEVKILICTHSNSAADLYIKEYLHPWVEKGIKEATPLRVYYHKRWVATVNSIVQKYCIIDGSGNFRRPTIDDILKHRIVVVTLNISMELASLGLPKGYFTHIFLDEAAQAMECEAIMPLALASEQTRIVLAGDHMQMSPELFSNFAKERKLHISLLERLYDHYPSNFPCKILLCENYRAHEAIIRFTSELFYEQKLIASGKQPKHDRFYPLTFFTTRGEDVQDKNSTAFYNNSEVYEVVERVCELRKKWPSSWGKINDSSIGIMTPYADQVFRIRSELRKRRMGGISVERVLNVQGKQFRAIFLSTVRTRRTCTPNNTNFGVNNGNGQNIDDSDYGFLSNSKLLNTAITRAQSLVAVVGDPVALCSIGRCRKVWERFIDICNQNKSLFGITWSYLRSQLDGVEFKRSYVLNPLAPEFIPRALQPESYLRKQTAMIVGSGNQQHLQQMFSQAAQAQALQPIFNNHSYNMLNQSMLGPQIGQKPPQQIAAATNSMQIRPMGSLPQSYNFSGQAPPPQITPNPQQQQFSQYMIWPPPPPQQPQQQPPPPNQMMRPNYPPTQPQPIQPPPQNPNANLWGPPPQSNPWGVIPKSVVNPNLRSASQTQQQPPPQQQAQSGLNINLRPSTVPPLIPNSTTQGQQSTVVGRNPHDPLSFLRFNNQNPATAAVLGQINTRNNLHNGPSSPAGMTTVGPQPQDSNSMANFHSRITQLQQQQQHPYMTGPQQISDKKEFQFLNNVHNIPLNLNTSTGGAGGNTINHQSTAAIGGQNILNIHSSSSATPNTILQSQQSSLLPFTDFSVLLPPNMNFYDMALEPKEVQYKWYLRLLEIQGEAAANKFTEILRSFNTNLAAVAAVNTNTVATKNILGQNTQQQQNLSNTSSGHSIINSSGGVRNNSSIITSAGAGNDNFNQQIDLVFNSLMNGNDMSQPILRDLLGMVGNSNTSNASNGGNGGGNLINQKDNFQFQSTNQLYSSMTTPLMGGNNVGVGTDLCLSTRSESVPLYRRQVMGNTTATTTSDGLTSSSLTSSALPNNIRSMASSSTPDHLLENHQNIVSSSTIAASLSTGSTFGGFGGSTIANHLHNNHQNINSSTTTSSSLIESLFSGSDLSPYTNVNSIQKLLYNYQLKQNNEIDHHAPHHHLMVNSSSSRHLPATNNQHHQQAQQNHHFAHNSHNNHHTNIGTGATYAAVLTQGSAPSSSQQQQNIHHLQQQHHPPHQQHQHEERDPFAAIRELGQRSNGYYNYFQ